MDEKIKQLETFLSARLAYQNTEATDFDYSGVNSDNHSRLSRSKSRSIMIK